jgi:drug/metabolite transporter (DMT)-like permease
LTERSGKIRADLALLLLCLIWGTSFPLMRASVRDLNPAVYLSARFWIAAILLLPIFLKRFRTLEAGAWRKGFALGAAMFAGMFCQTAGLKYTSASNSGFLTALSVVLVPVWNRLFRGRGLRTLEAAGIALASVGVALVAGAGAGGWNRGDALTAAGAVAFSVQIVLIQGFVGRDDSLPFAWMMIFWTAVLAAAAAPFCGPVSFDCSAPVAAGVLYLGVFATAAGFWGQTRFQPRTSSTAAAVVYATEPVFAAVFARIFLGEALTARGWIGGGLIFAGICIHEAARPSGGSQ